MYIFIIFIFMLIYLSILEAGGVAVSHLRGSQNNLAEPVHEEHTVGTHSWETQPIPDSKQNYTIKYKHR